MKTTENEHFIFQMHFSLFYTGSYNSRYRYILNIFKYYKKITTLLDLLVTQLEKIIFQVPVSIIGYFREF